MILFRQDEMCRVPSLMRHKQPDSATWTYGHADIVQTSNQYAVQTVNQYSRISLF